MTQLSFKASHPEEIKILSKALFRRDVGRKMRFTTNFFLDSLLDARGIESGIVPSRM
jgi:hypothetical protein